MKNCELKESEEDLSFKLSSNNGNIELKLFEKKDYEQWKNKIKNIITESFKLQESDKSNEENAKKIQNKFISVQKLILIKST